MNFNRYKYFEDYYFDQDKKFIYVSRASLIYVGFLRNDRNKIFEENKISRLEICCLQIFIYMLMIDIKFYKFSHIIR